MYRPIDIKSNNRNRIRIYIKVPTNDVSHILLYFYVQIKELKYVIKKFPLRLLEIHQFFTQTTFGYLSLKFQLSTIFQCQNNASGPCAFIFTPQPPHPPHPPPTHPHPHPHPPTHPLDKMAAKLVDDIFKCIFIDIVSGNALAPKGRQAIT